VAAKVWPVVHAERAALAADLERLPANAWSTPSLCYGWTVQDVLGHMTATAKMTPPRFLTKMAASGFRFDRMVAKEIAAETASSPQATLAEFRAHTRDTTAPPGPATSWLGETVVHGTDIRWPLGLERAFPSEALVPLADFYRRSNAIIGSKRRIVGLRLSATDADWSAGEGPEVSGPLLALIMAMTGRKDALGRLDGPGVATLRERK
jgi:uncharacterized protein (TIGR03083 family)